jgi:SAM-dependent methyltransferase
MQDVPQASVVRAHAGPHRPAEFADQLYAWESLRPAGDWPPMDRTEPYTLPWFESIETQRHGRQGRWIPRLLEFSKHRGETLLGLGSGLGTDWVQYARHGAAVVVCSPAREHLTLCQRNFELRGLAGRFLHAPPEALPLASTTIDVACVSGLLQDVAEPGPVVEEIYRVLKPGGKVLVVAPAYYDVDWWYRACFPWLAGLLRKRRVPGGPGRFSARRLRRLFGRFVEHRIHKRHLSRADVPRIWRWAPRSALERVMGRVLVLKAFKPLSAAISIPAAA